MEVRVHYLEVIPRLTAIEVDDKYKPLATDSFADLDKLPPELFDSFIKDVENATKMPMGDNVIRDDDLDINVQLEEKGFYSYIDMVEDEETPHHTMAVTDF